MSDIPDWLVELAAQRNQSPADEEPEERSPEPAASVPEAGALDMMDTLRSQVDDELPEDAPEPARRGLFGRPPSTVVAGAPAGAAVAAADGNELRPAREARAAVRIAGLLPWQQLVLAVLVFLDVVVIGLLFLVMLGRVAIP